MRIKLYTWTLPFENVLCLYLNLNMLKVIKELRLKFKFYIQHKNASFAELI